MKPQFIKTENGSELVILPRKDFDDLVRRAKDNEDVGTARIVGRTNAALKAGREVELPAHVAEAIARGVIAKGLLGAARSRPLHGFAFHASPLRAAPESPACFPAAVGHEDEITPKRAVGLARVRRG